MSPRDVKAAALVEYAAEYVARIRAASAEIDAMSKEVEARDYKCWVINKPDGAARGALDRLRPLPRRRCMVLSHSLNRGLRSELGDELSALRLELFLRQ